MYIYCECVVWVWVCIRDTEDILPTTWFYVYIIRFSWHSAPKPFAQSFKLIYMLNCFVQSAFPWMANPLFLLTLYCCFCKFYHKRWNKCIHERFGAHNEPNRNVNWKQWFVAKRLECDKFDDHVKKYKETWWHYHHGEPVFMCVFFCSLHECNDALFASLAFSLFVSFRFVYGKYNTILHDIDIYLLICLAVQFNFEFKCNQ